jgi:primary-amine oxidase
MRAISFAAFAAIFVLFPSAIAAQAPTHPLDGLSPAEHWTAHDVVRDAGNRDSTTKFAYVGLHEPPKSEVLAWKPGQSFRREARVHVVTRSKGYEGVVDLTARRLLSWTEVPGRQYMAISTEDDVVNEMLKSHPQVRAALQRRGITDLEHVRCYPNNEGYFDLPEERGKRIMRAKCGNAHGRFSGGTRPIAGLYAVVDPIEKKVLRVVDEGPMPEVEVLGEHGPDVVGPTRAALPPMVISQPMGPGFTVEGQQVSWEHWRFHFRIDPRRGIVLSQVRYADKGAERSVMYQGSISELYVPYMDPNEPWSYQSFFDLGSYAGAFGGVASTLEPERDCPAHARYFDAVVGTESGAPTQRVRAACLFERVDGDPSWRHSRADNRVIESRVKRDLVLRMIMTAGNYDYLFDWVFQQNGSLKVNTGATGQDQVKGVRNRGLLAGTNGMNGNSGGGSGGGGAVRDDMYGRFIAPNLVGVNHSHFFSFRLDLDVDGIANTVMVDRLVTERQPAANPRKSLWKVETVTARTEKDAMRHSTMAQPEMWRVVNTGVAGAYGDPVGYEVGGGMGSLTLMSADDYMQRRAGFTNHNLWVTPHNPAELYAAGDYPTVSTADQGLPGWTAANRRIENTDLVVWYTLGFHHVPRPEDWPIMPVAWHGFEIRPVGFFARNPALDLPR